MIRRGLSFGDYLEIDALNFSTLRHIETSPLHYQRARSFALADTFSMRTGRLTHSLVLTPNAPVGLAIYEGKVRHGKVWDAFAVDHADEIIVTRKELAGAEAMRKAVMAYGPARELLEDGEGEVTIEWESDPGHLGSAKLKGRCDWLGARGLVDLKTTRSIGERAFAKEAAQRRMGVQLGMYAWGLGADNGAAGIRGNCHIIAVENVPPHDVVVYRVPEEVIDAGVRTAHGWIERVAECTEAGVWPGVGGDKPLDLKLPDWALTDGLEDVDVSGIGGELMATLRDQL